MSLDMSSAMDAAAALIGLTATAPTSRKKTGSPLCVRTEDPLPMKKRLKSGEYGIANALKAELFLKKPRVSAWTPVGSAWAPVPVRSRDVIEPPPRSSALAVKVVKDSRDQQARVLAKIRDAAQAAKAAANAWETIASHLASEQKGDPNVVSAKAVQSTVLGVAVSQPGLSQPGISQHGLSQPSAASMLESAPSWPAPAAASCPALAAAPGWAGWPQMVPRAEPQGWPSMPMAPPPMAQPSMTPPSLAPPVVQQPPTLAPPVTMAFAKPVPVLAQPPLMQQPMQPMQPMLCPVAHPPQAHQPMLAQPTLAQPTLVQPALAQRPPTLAQPPLMPPPGLYAAPAPGAYLNPAAAPEGAPWHSKRLMGNHERWQSGLLEMLRFASPQTKALIAPLASLDPLGTALAVSRLSAFDLARIDVPVRKIIAEFQQRAMVLLWQNPELKALLPQHPNFGMAQ